MSTALITQVANQWLSDYTASFLNDGEDDRAVLAEQRRWCAWLKGQLGPLAQRFQAHLRETGHFASSAAVITERWETWIDAIFHSLTEQWLADDKEPSLL